jgi:hypothetical protein
MYQSGLKDTRTEAGNNTPAQARGAFFPNAATPRRQNTRRFQLLQQPEKLSLSSYSLVATIYLILHRSFKRGPDNGSCLHITLQSKNLTLKLSHLNQSGTV